jgi:hypothetical protein
MQSEEHAKDHGRISNLPPSGYFFSKTKSYMLWATLEGKKLKVRTMTPQNRELLFTTVENRLRGEEKGSGGEEKGSELTIDTRRAAT